MSYFDKYFIEDNGATTDEKVYPLYPCKIEHWRKLYNQRLPEALSVAKQWIEKGIPKADRQNIRWLQLSQTTEPQFQHLCFKLNGAVYSVLIELVVGNQSMLRPHHIKNQLIVTKNNNLIPCVLQLDYDTLHPMVKVSHLIYTDIRRRVIYPTTTQTAPMSAWEMLNYGIIYMKKQLKAEGAQIISYTNLQGIQPTIWFKRDNKRCYLIINVGTSSTDTCRLSAELLSKLSKYDGYYTYLQVKNTTDTTKSIINRTDDFSILYNKMVYIEQKALEDGVNNHLVDTIS